MWVKLGWATTLSHADRPKTETKSLEHFRFVVANVVGRAVVDGANVGGSDSHGIRTSDDASLL